MATAIAIKALLLLAACIYRGAIDRGLPEKTMTRATRAFVFLIFMTGATSLAADSEHDDISEFRLPIPDPRSGVQYSLEERSYILGQMRLFLATSQRIVDAAAAGDRTKISHLATVVGAKHNEKDPSRPAGLRDRQPVIWTHTIGEVRKSFDNLAANATSQSIETSLKQLSLTMQLCVQCHQSFHIVE